MTQIKFEEIKSETLPFIKHLLFERNGTLHTYTEWKYGEGGPKGFRGVVALKGNKPVGCFGLLPKMLRLGSKKIPCGWFADWYVTPSMRDSGLGTSLLQKITQQGYALFFGHPGPTNAAQICLKNGWQAIPFQSSRYYIGSPSSYFQSRSRHLTKRLFLNIRYHYLQKTQKQWFIVANSKNVPDHHNYFTNQNYHWHLSQPVNHKITRIYDTWVGREIRISYCDDLFPTGEVRRRVLSMENLNKDTKDIFSFFAEVKKLKISHVDIFTTDKFTDQVLARAGAVRFKESPVVCYGEEIEVRDLMIQGIDRENWLYLAGNI